MRDLGGCQVRARLAYRPLQVKLGNRIVLFGRREFLLRSNDAVF